MTVLSVTLPRRFSVAALTRALGRFRLPSYTFCMYRLGNLASKVRVLYLWQEIFGDEPPSIDSAFDLCVEFVGRVHHERFPVDLEEMDHLQEMLWSSDDEDWEDKPDSILDLPIPLLGFGIPWEMAGLTECRQDAVPLLAILDDQLEARAFDRGFDPGYFQEWVQDYWDARGRHEPPAWGIAETGQRGIRVLQQALRLLPAPLDALGDLVDCILRDSGSPWLDRVSGGYEIEYDEDGCIWDYDETWNVTTVRHYATLFAPVRPAFDRIDAYEKWFDETEGAEAQILAELERLVAGGWTIQEDHIIYGERIDR